MGSSDNPAETRLAVYGTLAPGRVNAGQLAHLKGSWRQGTVRGRLVEAGWGSELGYPGMILDPSEGEVEVMVFDSPDLPGFWPRLDDFEGPGYQRVLTQVRVSDGDVDAWIYVVDT